MFEIFREMVKEEWRIHSSLFGGLMFALFPVLISAIAFAGSFFLPTLLISMPLESLLISVQVTFIIFGISIGSFGLFGREVMNRRFGQASLLAYSSRSLPVSDSFIFLNFIAKDILYYFFLWILPFALGFAAASALNSISLLHSINLLLILTLSFIFGLSVSFLLSTIYAHSKKILACVIAISAAAILIINSIGSNYISSIIFFSLAPSTSQIYFYILASSVLFSLAFAFLKVDYPESRRRFGNSLNSLSEKIPFSAYPVFTAKDFLDISRSEGGIGKIIFSFMIPLAMLMWLLNSVVMKMMPELKIIVLFSIFLGILSSSFYNWLTEYDSFNSYSFLPIKVSEIIKSKINGFILMNIISVILLMLVASFTESSGYFLTSLVIFISLSSYSLAVTVYLGGLNPNIHLYSAKIFLEYFLLTSPVILTLIFLSLLFPQFLVLSIFLIPTSYRIILSACKKWDEKEQISI